MPDPKLTPEQEKLARQFGYFVDTAEEDKWLLRSGDKLDWIGPTAATELEVRLWLALEVLTAEVEQVRVATDEMNTLPRFRF